MLVFVLTNTLIAKQPELRLAQFARLSGLSLDEVEHRLWHSGFASACAEGRIRRPQASIDASRMLGAQIGRTAFESTWLSAYAAIDGAEVLLDQLRTRFELAGVTDAPVWVKDRLPLQVPYVQHLRPQVYSCDVGRLLPHTRMFAGLLQTLDQPAQDTLMIDTDPATLAMAASYGMRTLQLGHGGTTLETLAADLLCT